MSTQEPQYRLREIKLELTYRCPLKCIHCSSEAGEGNLCEMTYEQAMSIVEQAIDMEVEEIAFSGGEPLVWPGLNSAISRCSSAGLKTLVYTCGNVPNVGSAMHSLKTAGTGRVIFSVFAADPAVHDSITTVQGSLNATLAAAEDARRVGLETEFHFVPMQVNYRQLPQVSELAKAMGAVQLSVLRFVPQGRGRDASGMALAHDQNLELQAMIRESSKELCTRAGSPYNFLLVNKSPACKAATDRLSVGPNLRIYPCDAFKQVQAEDVAQTAQYSRLDRWPLRQCWERSPYFIAVRRYLSSPFSKPCAQCRLLEQCLSGCLAQKYLANGTLDKAPDPMCLMGHRGPGTCQEPLPESP